MDCPRCGRHAWLADREGKVTTYECGSCAYRFEIWQDGSSHRAREEKDEDTD